MSVLNKYVIYSAMKWEIVYYSENIEQQILALPNDLKAHYLRLADLMGMNEVKKNADA